MIYALFVVMMLLASETCSADMATDHIRYDILAQAALRGVVRTVLADVAKKGLPGEHHFKITFNTTAPGVRLSDRMRAQYPEAMTIVMQHQFWDLHVDDDAFEVGLSFGGVPERLAVPFEAVTAFYDPAVQFGFQFETLDAAAGKRAGCKLRRELKSPPLQSLPFSAAEAGKPSPLPLPAPSRQPSPPIRRRGLTAAQAAKSCGLDRFRKK